MGVHVESVRLRLETNNCRRPERLQGIITSAGIATSILGGQYMQVSEQYETASGQYKHQQLTALESGPVHSDVNVPRDTEEVEQVMIWTANRLGSSPCHIEGQNGQGKNR